MQFPARPARVPNSLGEIRVEKKQFDGCFFPFRPGAALLLCTDGLSDMLTSAEISSIVERYSGDPATTARDLVAAANQSGGKDNVSVIFVAGSEFLGSDSAPMLEARARHSVTQAREIKSWWRKFLNRLAGGR